MTERKKRIAVCVLASVLVHTGLFVVAGNLRDQPAALTHYGVLPEPGGRPEMKPFQRRKGVYIPPDLRSRAWSTLDLKPQMQNQRPQRSQQALGESRSILEGLTPVEVSHLDSAVPTPRALEQLVLQGWQDSLNAYREIDDHTAVRPSSPFETATAAFLGQSLVVVDPQTGRLLRANWRLPVYGLESCMRCARYDSLFRDFEDRLESVLQGQGVAHVTSDPFADVRQSRLQPLPVSTTLEDGYSFNASMEQQQRRVDVDTIHTYGWVPFRDVLTALDIDRFPVLLLQWIDPQSTELLAQYLVNGGYVVARPAQLELLASALTRQTGPDRVQRVDIWSSHPLMGAYYAVDDYVEPPRKANKPPLEGLQFDGRLVAVTVRSRRPEVFVNAFVYGLTQSSLLRH